jgi:hypothetical protein
MSEIALSRPDLLKLKVVELLERLIATESKLDAKEKREADLTRAWESKLYEYGAQVQQLQSRLDSVAKLLDDWQAAYDVKLCLDIPSGITKLRQAILSGVVERPATKCCLFHQLGGSERLECGGDEPQTPCGDVSDFGICGLPSGHEGSHSTGKVYWRSSE